jgi:glycosyltransferase involved in cell wall biosynthesis
MNILFLTQILPYPPDAGPKVKTWHVLRYLAGQGHKITLASFVRKDEEKYLDHVRALGIELYPVAIQRSRLADGFYLLRSFLTGRPFLIERDDLPEMRRLIDRLLAERSYDVVHTDQLTMTQFAPQGPRPPSSRPLRIFDAHNATWSIMERMQSTARAPLKPIIALERQRIKQYEARILREFEHTLAVTDIDRRLLLQAVAETAPLEDRERGLRDVEGRILTVPIAVDCEVLKPARRPVDSTNILTLGTLHYPPNADGIRWFIQEVFPLVQRQLPNVTLTIVGKNPPPDFVQLAQEQPQSIQVTGYVEDLTPYFERAAVTVVPVRAGSGMRVRILEAFARGMPAVTTTVGLEGIDARPGEDVLVADTPEDFARDVQAVLLDPKIQVKLAQNGRLLAEQKYDWQQVLCMMESLYRE